MKLLLLAAALVCSFEHRAKPEGWKPETVGIRLNLEVTAERPKVKRGSPLVYRVGLRNVGDADVSFKSRKSFFVHQNDQPGQFEFFLTGPDGIRKQIPRPLLRGPTDSRGGPFKPPRRGHALDLTLSSGEAIITEPRLLPLEEASTGQYRLMIRWNDIATGRKLDSNELVFDVEP